LITEELSSEINEFEEILQKLASAIASGNLSEKLSPQNLLQKTEHYVNRLTTLSTTTEESMLVLKPEKADTIKVKAKNLIQTLTTFKNILVQNTPDPLANSSLAFEQLRKALADGSDWLLLMRETRDTPSPLINAVLTFKKASETKGSVVNIQAPEDAQPFIKYILSRIDELKTGLVELEKKIGEMKQDMLELQEESLKILSGKTTEQFKPTENKTEKRQVSLSNFKAEKN
jgi:prefoldin subunit 5